METVSMNMLLPISHTNPSNVHVIDDRSVWLVEHCGTIHRIVPGKDGTYKRSRNDLFVDGESEVVASSVVDDASTKQTLVALGCVDSNAGIDESLDSHSHLRIVRFDTQDGTAASKFYTDVDGLITHISSIRFNSEQVNFLIFKSDRCLSVVRYDLVDGCASEQTIWAEAPELLPDEPFPGRVLAVARLASETSRWTLIGCDTGHVIACFVALADRHAVARSVLKFESPVSVLQLVETERDEEGGVALWAVLGACVGRPALWRAAVSPREPIGWRRVLELPVAVRTDCFVSAALSSDRTLFVCTHDGKLLRFRLRKEESEWCGTADGVVEFASPLVAAAPLPNALAVATRHSITVFDMSAVEELFASASS